MKKHLVRNLGSTSDTNLFTELAANVRAPSLIGDAVRSTYLLASLQQYGARNQSELSLHLQELTGVAAEEGAGIDVPLYGSHV